MNDEQQEEPVQVDAAVARPPFLDRAWERRAGGGPTRLEEALFGEASWPVGRHRSGVDPRAGRDRWASVEEALSWLLGATGASAAAYARIDLDDGRLAVVAAPGGLEPARAEDLAQRSRELFWAGALGEHRLAGGPAVTWYADRALRAMVLTGGHADPRPMLRLRAVLPGLPDARTGVHHAGRATGHTDGARPRMLAVRIVTDKGEALATASIRWHDRALTGEGRGPASEEGRHGAAARATLAALRPVAGDGLRLERLQLVAAGAGRLILVLIRLGERTLSGAAAVGAFDGEAAGGRAVLAALNRTLTRRP